MDQLSEYEAVYREERRGDKGEEGLRWDSKHQREGRGMININRYRTVRSSRDK